ncbi:hypothetical protein KTH81_06430 [Lachnospiraceae bacterium ASD3451]|uniref:permease prefix domain 1-containing protein n=1 Tax=Diplocloster agilis TaxID=2850323 RepID=UPI001D5706F2|nr:permease prefix domain 1-containing protein [Diplocloster agilis]MBU9743459.1 hypothetical protein [Diplocloster agilis]
MSDAIDKYLHEVLKKIHPAERRKKISEELTDHILSAYEDYLTQNYSEDEALKKALSDMGDPLKLGKKLNHTKYSKKIFAFWICTLFLISISLISVIDYTFYFGDYKKLIILCLFLMCGIALIIAAGTGVILKINDYIFAAYSGLVILDTGVMICFYDIKGFINTNYKYIMVTLYLIVLAMLCDKYDLLSKIKKKIFSILFITSLFITCLNPVKAPFIFLLIGYSILILKNFRRNIGKHLLKISILGIVFSVILMILILNYGESYQIIYIKNTLGFIKSNDIYQQQLHSRTLFTDFGNNMVNGNQVYEYLRDGNKEYLLAFLLSKFGIFMILFTLFIYISCGIGVIQNLSRIQDERVKSITYVAIGIFTFRIFYNLLMGVGFVPVTSISLPFSMTDNCLFISDCFWAGVLLLGLKRKERIYKVCQDV